MPRTLALVLLLAALTARAETITNAEIIALHRAGLSAEVIVQKLRVSTTAFDLSPNGLITLKQAGVPEAVITRMLTASTAVPSPSIEPTTSAPAAAPAGPNFTGSNYRIIWSDTCKVSFAYDNNGIVVRGETCRGGITHPWTEIRKVCFTFWNEHPGKPRNGRDRDAAHYKAEVALFLTDGTIATYGSSSPEAIKALQQDLAKGYPDILQHCEATYD